MSERVIEKIPCESSSFTLGILSIIFSLIIPPIGLIFGLIGIVMAKKAKEEAEIEGADKTKVATSGITCSIIGTVISSINLIVLILILIWPFFEAIKGIIDLG